MEAWGSGLAGVRVSGFGFRVWGLGFRAWGLGFWGRRWFKGSVVGIYSGAFHGFRVEATLDKC